MYTTRSSSDTSRSMHTSIADTTHCTHTSSIQTDKSRCMRLFARKQQTARDAGCGGGDGPGALRRGPVPKRARAASGWRGPASGRRPVKVSVPRRARAAPLWGFLLFVLLGALLSVLFGDLPSSWGSTLGALPYCPWCAGPFRGSWGG